MMAADVRISQVLERMADNRRQLRAATAAAGPDRRAIASARRAALGRHDALQAELRIAIRREITEARRAAQALARLIMGG